MPEYKPYNTKSKANRNARKHERNLVFNFNRKLAKKLRSEKREARRALVVQTEDGE
jgi:hypothetical protein